MFRDRIRKAKVKLELNLTKNTITGRAFYRCVNWDRKVKGVSPLKTMLENW